MSNYPTGPYCRPEPTAAPQARTSAERERFAAQADRSAGRAGPDHNATRATYLDRSSGRSGAPTRSVRDAHDYAAGRAGAPATSRTLPSLLRRLLGR